MQHTENQLLTNTFGVIAKARHSLYLSEEQDWQMALNYCQTLYAQTKSLRSPLILGGGSNIIFIQDYEGVVIHSLSKHIRHLDQQTLVVDAGVIWHDLVDYCVHHGLYGLENLALIPGTVGASPIQNIGAYGVEVKEFIKRVHSLDPRTGKVIIRNADECAFAYRDSIFKHAAKHEWITQVELTFPPRKPVLNYPDIQKKILETGNTKPSPEQVFHWVVAIRSLKLPNPKITGNAGSFFKNPLVTVEQLPALNRINAPLFPQADGRFKTSAAYLIDQAGLKGHRMGGAAVSRQHALVLINENKASGQEVLALAQWVQQVVNDRFGLRLETEPVFV